MKEAIHFEVSPDQAFVVSGSRKTDEVNGRDVGGEQRGAHHSPRQRAAGKEEHLPGHLCLATGEDSDGQDDQDVDKDDHRI